MMMRRVTELVGKPIVTSDTGKDVGSAADVLVSQDGSRLVGFVITRGTLRGEKGVLPFEQVQSLGRDVIVAKGEPLILDREQWADEGVASIRSSSFVHKRIVTTDGRRLGEVKDLCVDERSGDIAGYEVVESGFAGLVQRRRTVERSGRVVVGPDVVILDADALAENESEAREPMPGTDAAGGMHPDPLQRADSTVKPGMWPGRPGRAQPIEPRK
jgi:uncharacterized protein YrrD